MTPKPMEFRATWAIAYICLPSSPFHEVLVVCGIGGCLALIPYYLRTRLKDPNDIYTKVAAVKVSPLL